jgi:hypothetical protein
MMQFQDAPRNDGFCYYRYCPLLLKLYAILPTYLYNFNTIAFIAGVILKDDPSDFEKAPFSAVNV